MAELVTALRQLGGLEPIQRSAASVVADLAAHVVRLVLLVTLSIAAGLPQGPALLWAVGAVRAAVGRQGGCRLRVRHRGVGRSVRGQQLGALVNHLHVGEHGLETVGVEEGALRVGCVAWWLSRLHQKGFREGGELGYEADLAEHDRAEDLVGERVARRESRRLP